MVNIGFIHLSTYRFMVVISISIHVCSILMVFYVFDSYYDILSVIYQWVHKLSAGIDSTFMSGNIGMFLRIFEGFIGYIAVSEIKLLNSFRNFNQPC